MDKAYFLTLWIDVIIVFVTFAISLTNSYLLILTIQLPYNHKHIHTSVFRKLVQSGSFQLSVTCTDFCFSSKWKEKKWFPYKWSCPSWIFHSCWPFSLIVSISCDRARVSLWSHYTRIKTTWRKLSSEDDLIPKRKLISTLMKIYYHWVS